MIRMFSRREYTSRVAAGTDLVFSGIDLPPGSTLNNVNLEVHVWQQETARAEKLKYMVEGYILPVFDPEVATFYNTIWDQLVPKDIDTDTVDLDTGAVDTSPFSEPGEVNWAQIMDVGLKPEKIYSRTKMLSFANSSFGNYDSQTAYPEIWTPRDVFHIKLGKRRRVYQPSIVAFAIGSPAYDDTTATELTTLSEAEWPRMRYIEMVLEQAITQLLGLVEAGAETPWEEATALLRKVLEPDVIEMNVDELLSVNFDIWCYGVYDISVEGRIAKPQLTSGR